MWSTDSGTNVLSTRETPFYEIARAGGTSSRLAKGLELTPIDGVNQTTDVVETYLPLRTSLDGDQIGVVGIFRDVSMDISVQVSDTKTAVFWTTVAAMGLLFVVLAGFVVFAETNLHRSRRRELDAVNSRLLESEKAEGTLRMLQRRLLSAQENERSLVSRELHDEIGQDLTGIKLLLERIPQLSKEQLDVSVDEGRELTASLIGKVSDLYANLLPSVLIDFGLAAALESLIERQRNQSGLRIRFENSMKQERFGSEIELAAYRIVQESLTNISRHASAEQATVRILTNNSTLNISVEDDGVGFDEAAALDGRTSVGLQGMKQRAELLGGELRVESAHGKGTVINATLPVGYTEAS